MSTATGSTNNALAVSLFHSVTQGSAKTSLQFETVLAGGGLRRFAKF